MTESPSVMQVDIPRNVLVTHYHTNRDDAHKVIGEMRTLARTRVNVTTVEITMPSDEETAVALFRSTAQLPLAVIHVRSGMWPEEQDEIEQNRINKTYLARAVVCIVASADDGNSRMYRSCFHGLVPVLMAVELNNIANSDLYEDIIGNWMISMVTASKPRIVDPDTDLPIRSVACIVHKSMVETYTRFMSELQQAHGAFTEIFYQEVSGTRAEWEKATKAMLSGFDDPMVAVYVSPGELPITVLGHRSGRVVLFVTTTDEHKEVVCMPQPRYGVTFADMNEISQRLARADIAESTGDLILD